MIKKFLCRDEIGYIRTLEECISHLQKRIYSLNEEVRKNKLGNDELFRELEKLKESDGYLVMISRLKGDTLIHTYFTKNFRRDDIAPSLDEHAKLLKSEIIKKEQ